MQEARELTEAEIEAFRAEIWRFFREHGHKSALGTQNFCVTGANPRWERKIFASRGHFFLVFAS